VNFSGFVYSRSVHIYCVNNLFSSLNTEVIDTVQFILDHPLHTYSSVYMNGHHVLKII